MEDPKKNDESLNERLSSVEEVLKPLENILCKNCS